MTLATAEPSASTTRTPTALSSIPRMDAVAPAAEPVKTATNATPAPAQNPAPVAAAPAAKAAEPAAAAAPAKLLGDAPATDKTAAVPGADAAKNDPAAPKASDWTLTIVDGSPLSVEDGQALEALAKKHGMTEAQAKAILERDVAKATESTKAAETARVQAADKIASDWYAQAQADTEIGGDKLPIATANAKRALLAFATADERKAISDSPFANNPLFLRILNRAAAALPKEDTVHQGGAPKSDGPIDPAAAIYGSRRRG